MFVLILSFVCCLVQLLMFNNLQQWTSHLRKLQDQKKDKMWHFDQIPTLQYFIDGGSGITKICYIHTIIGNSINNAESMVQ